MGNQNSLFKKIVLLSLLAIAFVYAWPNMYQELPVVEIQATKKPASAIKSQVESILESKN